MTDEEIRIASAQQLMHERESFPNNPETTPSEITAVIQTFCETLASIAPAEIPVSDDPLGRYGWCNDGVRLKVAADGGQPVHGWTIWEWPSMLLTAEFHCVWRSPSGELIDITPKPRRETTIVFVEDPKFPADFDFDKRPRNRRARIYQPVDRQKLVNIINKNLVGSQRLYEERRSIKFGITLDEWLGRKIAIDPLPRVIDDLISACADFEEYYDSLGSSGMVAVDRKLAELGKRRFEAQSRFKKLAETSSARLP